MIDLVTLTGSRPAHVHCNGMPLPQSTRARQLFNELVTAIPGTSLPPNNGLVVAAFSNRRPGSTPIEQSAAALGYRLALLGQGVRKWENRGKLALAIRFLRQTAAEIVLLSDSHDALFVRPPAELLAAFAATGCRVLASAERGDYPPDAAVAAHERLTRRYRTPWVHLNSGGIIGYRADLLRLYEAAEKFGRHPQVPTSDQWCLRQAALEAAVRRDETAEVFLSLFGIQPGDLQRSARPSAQGE